MANQIPISNIRSPNMTPIVSPGYPDLAKLMGAYTGMSIYLRFSHLNSRDLLVYQAEILQLEEDLEVYDQDTSSERTLLLKTKGNQRTPIEKERWHLQMRLRSKLKDYSMSKCATCATEVGSNSVLADEALLRQARIQQLQKPNQYDLSILNRWLEHEKGGNSDLEDIPWTETERAWDLIALSRREQDYLTSWAAEKLIPWFLRKEVTSRVPIAGQEELGLVEYSDDSYTTSSRVISVITSSLLPSLAIVILYLIHSLLARIFVAMGLSFLFSIALALLTSARAAEIFASTAAFAAVLVVFIGSTSISPSGNT